MASQVGLIVRTTNAQNRTDSAVQTIIASGIEGVSPGPPRERDAALTAMLREEWLADVLEQVVAQGVKPAPKSRSTKKES